MNSQGKVVVIGAGISGLCVAYWLKKRGISVLVLEKDSQVGGTMKTIRDNGWLIELGPNTALETTPLFRQMFNEIGIAHKQVYANEAAAKRYILRNGILHPLPMGLGSFLTSKLWTWQGKLHLLKDPFVGPAYREESVAEFVRRRLGSEFLDYAINPFVAGVYAGDPEQLSVRAAFPKLYALEEKYGGLVKGLIKGRKERKQRDETAKSRARLFSFVDGIQSFPDALAASLGDSIKLSREVGTIIPVRAGRYPVYAIYGQKNEPLVTEVSAVVLSTPAYSAATMVRPIDPEMARTLESIYYPPVVEAFMGFRLEQVKQPLDGFGFLVPEKEQRKLLGTIWSSTLFPHCAPKGYAALTTFVAGARQPELAEENDGRIVELVLSELQSIMGITGAPAYTKITRWERAIPQYTLGYPGTLKQLQRFEENFRGAFLCANYRGGIAVGDCLMSAEKTVKRVLEHLRLVRADHEGAYVE